MEESGYGFPKPLSLGHVIKAKPYGPNATQKMIQRQGNELVTPRICSSDVPSWAVKRTTIDTTATPFYLQQDRKGQDFYKPSVKED